MEKLVISHILYYRFNSESFLCQKLSSNSLHEQTTLTIRLIREREKPLTSKASITLLLPRDITLSVKMFSSMTSKYEQIPNEEGEKHPSSFVNVNRSTITRQVLLISACFVAGILGFFAAQRASRLESTPGGLDCELLRRLVRPNRIEGDLTGLLVKMEPHVFQYNRSFSYPPSNITNRAWRDIFPQEGGFFIHPTIAPTRSTFSVFHQLHCLVFSLHPSSPGKLLTMRRTGSEGGIGQTNKPPIGGTS